MKRSQRRPRGSCAVASVASFIDSTVSLRRLGVKKPPRCALLVLDASEIIRLLDMASCIRAVEAAFRARGEGRPVPSAALGFPLDGGSLHVKVASLDLSRPYVVAKVNANFPRNPEERKLPTIQGALVLLDATCGTPLAVMDSAPITTHPNRGDDGSRGVTSGASGRVDGDVCRLRRSGARASHGTLPGAFRGPCLRRRQSAGRRR